MIMIVYTLIILMKIPNGAIIIAMLEALTILTPLNQSVKEESQFLANNISIPQNLTLKSPLFKRASTACLTLRAIEFHQRFLFDRFL